jgi:hypothetical protein
LFHIRALTLSNPIFLPHAYFPALVYFGRERGWWVTCNYPTVLKEKNRNRKSTTSAICWLKSVLHGEKRREQENHNVGRGLTQDRKGLKEYLNLRNQTNKYICINVLSHIIIIIIIIEYQHVSNAFTTIIRVALQE